MRSPLSIPTEKRGRIQFRICPRFVFLSIKSADELPQQAHAVADGGEDGDEDDGEDGHQLDQDINGGSRGVF